MPFVFLFPSLQSLCSLLVTEQFNLYRTIIFLWKTNKIQIPLFHIRLWLKAFESFMRNLLFFFPFLFLMMIERGNDVMFTCIMGMVDREAIP